MGHCLASLPRGWEAAAAVVPAPTGDADPSTGVEDTAALIATVCAGAAAIAACVIAAA